MKSIIGIHGVPRSGTSWLFQIFNSSPYTNLKFQPLFSYAFKDYITTKSSKEDIEKFFELISTSDDYFVNMEDKEIHKNYPHFKKANSTPYLCFKHVRYHHLIEHFLINNAQVKFILIIRNPLAVLSSWYKAPREFNPTWDFNEEWRYANKKNLNRIEEYFGYEKWKETTLLFLNLKEKYPTRIEIITYNELLEDTANLVIKLFEFSEIPISDEVITFIQESKSRKDEDPNSVFKMKFNDDSWKKNIPKTIETIILQDLEKNGLSDYLR